MFVQATSSRSPTATIIAMSGVSNCVRSDDLPVAAEHQGQWIGEIARGSCSHHTGHCRGADLRLHAAERGIRLLEALPGLQPHHHLEPRRVDRLPASFPDLE